MEKDDRQKRLRLITMEKALKSLPLEKKNHKWIPASAGMTAIFPLEKVDLEGFCK